MAGNGGIIGPCNVISDSGKGGIGTITTATSDGNITTQPGTKLVQTLVVAGGGGGGVSKWSPGSSGGGGGAGGLRNITDIVVWGATAYPMTVGAGGASSTSGSDSVAGFPSNPITSESGGAGGDLPGAAGSDGGSGGGGAGGGSPTAGGAGNTPPTTPPQGNAGAAGLGSCPYYGGGGGGATAAGITSPAITGVGGVGTDLISHFSQISSFSSSSI